MVILGAILLSAVGALILAGSAFLFGWLVSLQFS